MDFKKFGLVFFLLLTLLVSTTFALAPVTTIGGTSPTTWQNVSADINLTCTPSDENLCVLTQYRIDEGAWQTYTIPFTISTDGNHSIDYNSTSGVGDGNVVAEEMNSTNTLIDKTAPTVGDTSLSDFSNTGSNLYGTGSIVGGTAVDTNNGTVNAFSDLNEDSCEYTTDGSNWVAGTWSTDHCEDADITINGGQDYSFGTRIADNAGNIGIGAVVNAHGAMLSGDTGAVVIDIVGEIFAGFNSQVGLIVVILILLVAVTLIVDLLTGTFGIIEKIRNMF